MNTIRSANQARILWVAVALAISQPFLMSHGIDVCHNTDLAQITKSMTVCIFRQMEIAHKILDRNSP